MTRFAYAIAVVLTTAALALPVRAQVVRDLLVGYQVSSMSLDRYSATTGTFVGPFATGGPAVTGYNFPAYSPSGSLFVSINNNPAPVLKFDGRTGTFISNFIPTSGETFTFGPDGNL